MRGSSRTSFIAAICVSALLGCAGGWGVRSGLVAQAYELIGPMLVPIGLLAIRLVQLSQRAWILRGSQSPQLKTDLDAIRDLGPVFTNCGLAGTCLGMIGIFAGLGQAIQGNTSLLSGVANCLWSTLAGIGGQVSSLLIAGTIASVHINKEGAP